MDGNGNAISEEGRLLLDPGAVLVQGASNLRESLLRGSLLEFLVSLEAPLAEVCGWALVNAAKRGPLISWKGQRPLLTMTPEHLEAFLFMGQKYQPEVLQRALGLAGILHHSHQSELDLFSGMENVLAEASESWVWNALLWRTGEIDVLRPDSSQVSSRGGHMKGLKRLSQVDPIAAEAAGWLLCRGAYQKLVVDCVQRSAVGVDPILGVSPASARVLHRLTHAGVLRGVAQHTFQLATPEKPVNHWIQW